MICAGIIVVLGYQLWSALQDTKEENEIFMYTAQGNARILPWGSGEWEKSYSGTRLLQGDAIKTQRGSRVVVEFFEDHFLRLDQRTEVIFSEIRDSDNGVNVNLILREGNIWINNNNNSKNPVKFTVQTNHTDVDTVSTIYEIEQNPDSEVLRVMRGSIQADILVDEDGRKNKVDTIKVGVGQEAVITQSALRKFAQRESPSVIDALSDDFKESNFYKWNIAEDKNPTDFSLKKPTEVDTLDDEGATENAEETTEEDLNVSDLAAPTITVPSVSPFTTAESSLTIRGTTSDQSKSMMVDVTAGGSTETYKLNLYIPGNNDWSYGVSQPSGTLLSGENTYEFYSVDENDLRSSKTTLKVIFEGEATDEEEDLDLGLLTAPTVDSFNGTEDNVVDVDTVKVVGTVSGAKEVNVSGYTLQAFKPGDTTWTYYAKESLGNMDPGENNYIVVATAPDGSTKQTSFTITYNKPEEAPTEEPPVSDEPATVQSAN